MRRAALVLATAAGAAACASFEDPAVVLDLRVLAITASPPEQVFDVDLEQPDPAAILAQLADFELTALVADPGADRPLRWSMTLCRLDRNRCDRTRPHVELGAGVIEDPDRSVLPQLPRAQLLPDAHGDVLLALVQGALEDNPIEALGGVQISVELVVGDVSDRASDVYAAKHLRLSPRIPTERAANRNPTLDRVESVRPDGLAFFLPQFTRCAEGRAETMRPGERITLYPIEADSAREPYVVPTLDGRTAHLEETLTYQWLATRGSWSDNFTGGGRDLLGNQSLLGSDWIAPRDVTEPTRVSLWVIQRDERFGSSWFESCVLVMP